MTHRMTAPITLFIVAVVCLAGCTSTRGPVTDTSAAEPPQNESDLADTGQEVLETVETMPKIIGGLISLQKRIRYPEAARKTGVQGRVLVRFVVNKQGSVEDAVVVKSVGDELDEEALRVVQEIKFTPGMEGGNRVAVRMTLPISFKLKHPVIF